MQAEWMKTRQTKYTLYVTVYLLIILAVLGAANWLANRHNKSIDFATARDLLDRYANLSTKLHVVYVDPDKKPQLAKAAGVRAYGETYVESGAKKEQAKSLTEEEITGAL